MSSLEESDSSSDSDENQLKGCSSGAHKVNTNSAVNVDDSAEEPIFSDKETLDHSSDEYNKSDTGGQKRDKKNYKLSKSKVKIKTLTIDGQLVYFCKICDKIFTRRKDKLNHELAHSGESVLTCAECGKEYLHESSLASHMRTHAGDPLYMCDLCPKMFAQSHHLKTHILSHSEPTNFVCKTCYTEFPTPADLSHHNRVQSKLEMGKYWCKMCKVYFCRSHKLTCNKRIHAFCCSACNELFYTHKKLKIHMKKFSHHSLEKPKYIEPLQEHELYPDKAHESFKKLQTQKENELLRKPPKNDLNNKRHNEPCDELPLKKFKLTARKIILDGDQSSTSLQDSAPEIVTNFEREMKSPTKNRKGKPYCKKCNKSFKDSLELDRHKALIHEDKQDSFICEICKIVFSSREELEKHGFKHSGEHNHTCPVCGQDFLNSLLLTKHLRDHVGDFPYKCSQCGKSFRLKIQLIQHVRLHIAQDGHTIEKYQRSYGADDEHHDHGEANNFECHLCSKKFCARYKLLNHLRLHTNVKCFQCYICHKTFATKSYLQRHLQIHIKQGMEVDIQNIIIDDDSKCEMESLKEQITKENCEGNEGLYKSSSFHDFEIENSRNPFLGIRKTVSNYELANKVNDYSCSSWGKKNKENENLNLNFSSRVIKVELEDVIDTVSEHSFCSSFTRDSERSDPFKFSSDESYSFKTAMAKERRRLKRKWKKSQSLFIKSDMEVGTYLKKNDVILESLCLETGDGDDVTDMMVELDTVKSEQDGVTTLYVNLMPWESLSTYKTSSACVTDMDTVPKVTSPLSSVELLKVKDEVVPKKESGESEAQNNKSTDNINAQKNTDLTTTIGKKLMFEIDVDNFLEGDIKQISDRNIDLAFEKFNHNQHAIDKQEVEVKTEAEKDKAQTVLKIAEDQSILSQNLMKSNQKPNLKFIRPDSIGTSESSNLEKLQAVFEHSSKYIPLSQTSIDQQHPSSLHSKALDNTVTDTKENKTEQSYSKISSHTMDTSSKSQMKESVSISSKAVNLITALNQQERLLIDNKQELKIQHSISHSHESRTDVPVSNIQEKPSKSQYSTLNKCRGKFDEKLLVRKASVETNMDNNKNINLGNLVFENRNSQNFTSAFMPQCSYAGNLKNDSPHFSSSSSVGFMAPTSTSTTSNLSHFSVMGTSVSSDFTHLQLNLQPPSVFNMNFNPSFAPVGVRDNNGENIAMSSNYATDQTNITGLFSSSLISSNPLIASNSALSLNDSSNQSLQLAVNQGSFPLNQAAIFDSTNTLYRDMNMMDLISTQSTVGTQAMPTTNLDFLRQSHMQSQLGHGSTSFVEPQSTILQPQNSFINLGNPTLTTNFGNFGNPIDNLINHLPLNYGQLGNSLLNPVSGNSLFTARPISGHESLMTSQNIPGAVLRDEIPLGNFGIQQFSMNLGPLVAPAQVNIPSVYPMNTNNLANLDSFRTNCFGAPLSTNISDLGGHWTNAGFLPFSQTNLQCNFPSSISANPHIVNNLGAGTFSTSGPQDGLGNFIASSGINFLNSTYISQNNETLQAPTFGFINSFNTGVFPKF